MTTHCPRCQSPAPHLHPAVQVEGEVETCTHEFHLRQTPQNLPQYREAVLRKLETKVAEARGLQLGSRQDGKAPDFDSGYA